MDASHRRQLVTWVLASAAALAVSTAVVDAAVDQASDPTAPVLTTAAATADATTTPSAARATPSTDPTPSGPSLPPDAAPPTASDEPAIAEDDGDRRGSGDDEVAAPTRPADPASGASRQPPASADDGADDGADDDAADDETDDDADESPSASPGQATSGLDETRTVSAIGGTARLHFTTGGVDVVWATPSYGFSVEIDDEGGDEVRVEFESDAHTSRVDADLEDGAPRVRVREESEDD